MLFVNACINDFFIQFSKVFNNFRLKWLTFLLPSRNLLVDRYLKLGKSATQLEFNSCE